MSPHSDLHTDVPRRSPLLWTLLIGGALLAVAVIVSWLATDYFWFRSLNFQSVYTTQLATKLGLGIVFGIVLAGLIFGNQVIAYRLRPRVKRANLDSEFLIQLRDSLDQRSRSLMALPAIAMGVLGGLGASSVSGVFLAWLHATPFNWADPHFGLDASFYVFTLPWLHFVLGYLLFALVLSLIAAAAIHFMTGSLNSIALRGVGNVRVGVGAQRHTSILIGSIFLVSAANTFLGRYDLALTSNTLFTGVGYTDFATRAPVAVVMSAIFVICAGACFYNAWKVKWSIPAVAVVLSIISSMLLTTMMPLLVQRFEVTPDEQDKERPFIEKNIEATRYAFGIDNVEITDYEATTTTSSGQLRADADALPAIRLIDPAVVSKTFEQLQQVRGYYAFPENKLDVDRYVINGKPTDAVVAARELDLASVEAGDTWNNRRTVYTHGYGLVAAYGNQRETNGEPKFFSGGIPTVGELPEHEPRIYFGERTDYYVVVGAPEGQAPVELDTPSGGEGRSESLYTYTGIGGVPIGNIFTRAAFAIRFSDINLMLSDRVNDKSRILHDRVPTDRVREVAPWLTLDSDPYPSVVDGRIKWIIDAYTTSDSFPNSNQADWAQTISDSRTSSNGLSTGQEVNYVRNSVKAVVDAYDGSVTLYEWDQNDPILKTWSKVYPGIITPKEKISQSLLEHLRYPQDLFKAQRETLGRYHTTNTGTWYQQSDIWQVPKDPVNSQSGAKEPPYFLTIRWPGDQTPHFANTTVFVPKDRENLSVYMAVNADATSKDYGKIRVLKLSDKRQIAGPGQTFNFITTNRVVADALLPFNREGSTASAIYGNLLTLPLGGGLLYMQPIYTQTKATSGAYPTLRFIVVRFGEKIGIGGTLQEALDQVFQGDAGADTGEDTTTTQGKTPAVTQDNGNEQKSVAGTPARTLLDEAQALFEQANAALKSGDLAGYQSKVNQAQAKVEEAAKLLGDS